MSGRTFLILAIVLVAIDLLVPYLALADVTSFAGTFLFWCVLTLLVIVGAAWYTRGWSSK